MELQKILRLPAVHFSTSVHQARFATASLRVSLAEAGCTKARNSLEVGSEVTFLVSQTNGIKPILLNRKFKPWLG